MHHFMKRDGQGWSADRNNMMKSYKEARRAFGRDVSVIIAKGHTAYWCATIDVDHFKSTLEGEGREILHVYGRDEIKAKFGLEPAKLNGEGKERVRHPKFGVGFVVHGRGSGRVVVQFDGHKKTLPMVEASLEAI